VKLQIGGLAWLHLAWSGRERDTTATPPQRHTLVTTLLHLHHDNPIYLVNALQITPTFRTLDTASSRLEPRAPEILAQQHFGLLAPATKHNTTMSSRKKVLLKVCRNIMNQNDQF